MSKHKALIVVAAGLFWIGGVYLFAFLAYLSPEGNHMAISALEFFSFFFGVAFFIGVPGAVLSWLSECA